ncbi:16662_t:CDS:1 [Funneliformis geosporum]|uniref:16662_t:CDS:1 n=1 Tax=Funneliformis geosporum TaxID=1117311 RepID=A0A9W4T4S8_9GLOM|nr:16662_t:CDS:1 [Funneliformis geosporum]
MTKSPLGDGFEGTYEEHVEYIGLRHIMDGETPSEWRNRIWDRLMYFRNKKYYTYGEKDYFCAHKALLYLVDRQKLFPKCGMTICYSCNKVVYLGIEHLSVGERSVYNGLEGKFITERFRNISFNGEHWGIYQHWATACTGNKFRKLNFEE